jgi:tetratricopeptide (TPR) repeat protein
MKPVVANSSPQAAITLAAMALLVMALMPIASIAKAIDRQLPTACVTLIEFEQPGLDDAVEQRREANWNRYYRDGQVAISQGDLRAALQSQCLALNQARGFDESDWRFAETLDELGRIHYLLEEYNAAEDAQGAAVAELLLAVGPEDKGPDTRNVYLFIERLGLVYAQQGRSELTETMLAEPYTVFALGYIPLDNVLARRLDWLVSEYMGLENYRAANALMQLIAEIE